MQCKRIALTSVAHEIGVYEINQVKFDVYLKDKKEAETMELKDELIV
jgi:hypothetical protein